MSSGRLASHESVDRAIRQRYHVGRRIGRGCYGVVFEAQERGPQGRSCALKKMLRAFKNGEDAQRSYREVSYLQEFVGHRNILAVWNVLASEDDQHLYMVSELCDCDLSAVLRAGVSILQPSHQTCIVYQLLRGLKYLHSAGIVHRDVKPANILMNSNSDVKLADFGLARSAPVQSFGGPRDVPGGDMSEYVGSRWYRAPEILLGARVYSTPVDLWALGCVTAEIFSRLPLFPGTSSFDMIERISDLLGKPLVSDMEALQAPYASGMLSCVQPNPYDPPLEKIVPAPSEVHDFIHLLLQLNPEKRMSADEAITHPCLLAFANPDDEPEFGRFSLLQLSDNDRFEVYRYRDQIYADCIGIPRSRRLLSQRAAELARIREREADDEYDASV